MCCVYVCVRCLIYISVLYIYIYTYIQTECAINTSPSGICIHMYIYEYIFICLQKEKSCITAEFSAWMTDQKILKSALLGSHKPYLSI